MGKIKRSRQKLHHCAVKLENENEKAPIASTHVQSRQVTKKDLTRIKINTSDSDTNNNAKVSLFNLPYECV